ncbi:ZIP family metal transporter [Papillibacter cinnamivorans]|uniref:Zinc transporter, ZIP family n=1 Tax=Papillibacter cinnamivorans DSM 12816 TaxID=1122930 RepID=A0A1W2AHZ8_9FIRM|nr:ZIP family metal transporter [Papillibacter cinnamivorans]SMC60316.1 zinc transporter, ZIP family [Papillibacter cinnamivorans DSM 12816]
MNDLWTAALYGTIAGMGGTGAGGFLACFVPKKNKRVIGIILEYSAGLMTAIVCFDLMPGAFSFAPLYAVLLGMLAGAGVMIAAESGMDRKRTNRGVLSTGMAIALGIALHNFPEGLAVGSGFEAERSLGISLAAAIMLHDIPEGISIAVPLRAGGMGRVRALMLTLLTGLPMGLGAFIGALAGHISVFWIAICLSLAGGAMLYIVFADMIPESKRMYEGRFGSLGSVLGIITGILISVSL